MTERSWRALAASALTALVLLLVPAAASAAATAEAKGDQINVRSRPGFAGEVITRLHKGQTVAITEAVTLSRPATSEPADWLRITLPPGTRAWVAAEHADPTNGTVKADVLNVRAGPSYDHGSIARAKKGAVLKPLGAVKDGWLPVEAPVDAQGFVPASLVTVTGDIPARTASTNRIVTPPVAAPASPAKPPAAPATSAAARPIRTAAPAAATSTATNPPPPVRPRPAPAPAVTNSVTTPVTTPVTTAIPVPVDAPPSTPKPAPAPVKLAAASPAPAPTTSSVPANPAPVAPAPASPATSAPAAVPTPATSAPVPAPATTERLEPLPSSMPGLNDGEARRVRREGRVVRPSNIQAPAYYALQSRDSGKLINFLMTTRAEPLNWRQYHGRVVIITGREYLDRRRIWHDIPLLNVDNIEAVR